MCANASQLPVRVAQIASKIESTWAVEDRAQSRPDEPDVWLTEAGTELWGHDGPLCRASHGATPRPRDAR
jgi:hypothetical protein